MPAATVSRQTGFYNPGGVRVLFYMVSDTEKTCHNDNGNSRRDVAAAMWIVALLFLFNALFWNGGYVMTTGIPLTLARSLVEDGDIEIRNNCSPPLCKYQTAVQQYKGKVYSKFPLARSLIVVAFYAPVYWGMQFIGYVMPGFVDVDALPYDWIVKNCATFLNMLATALAAGLIFCTIRCLKYSRAAALYAAFVYGCASGMFSFTRSVQVEPVTALCVAVMILFWIHSVTSGTYSKSRIAYGALAVGCALSPQVVILYAAFMLTAIIRMNWKEVMDAAILFGVLTITFLLYNYARFHDVFDFGYSSGEQQHGFTAVFLAAGAAAVLALFMKYARGRLVREKTVWRLTLVFSAVLMCAAGIERPWAMYGYFISPTHGIFVYSIPFILAVAALWRLRTKNPRVALHIAIPLTVFLAYCVYHGMDKSFILTRYAAAVFPLFALLSGLFIDLFRNRILPIFLALAGFLVQMLITVDNVYNATFWSRAGSGSGVPPVPERFSMMYSLILYKMRQLLYFVPRIPDFLLHSDAYEGSYFFNSYWFVVYRQELPSWVIAAGVGALAIGCMVSAKKLVHSLRG